MRKPMIALLVASLALALAACSAPAAQTADPRSVNANQGATIGLALPTRAQTRWIADGTNMVQQFTDMGYVTDLRYADDDGPTQIQQIQAMIDNGDQLLVIGAVDSTGLTPVLANAAKAGIPVIAYDRLIRNSPAVGYYATFDNLRVGVLQANLLVKRLGLNDAGGGAEGGSEGPFTIELFAGAKTDNNAGVFFEGAMSVLQPYIDSGDLVVKSGQTTFAEVATANWDAPTATKRMRGLLDDFYPDGDEVDAVLSPNDGLALGILAAFEAPAGSSPGKPRSLPLISGQDAELGSVKSIIAGQQTGTVFKDTRELAKVAVQMGNALLTGSTPIVNDTTTYDNGVKKVPTYLLEPIAVDQANYRTLLVDGGYYDAASLS